MRVIKLTAENFRGLRAIEITPTEHIVTVSGRNGQGKTSVLDAIWAAIAGGSAARSLPAPVRQGEDTATVSLDLGDLQVTRTWTHGGGRTALKVVSKAGKRISSPQAVLDRLVGALTFDPLTFSRLDERGQVAQLIEVIDLPFDPDELDAERAGLFARRTDVAREARRLVGQAENTPASPPGLPAREVSVAELSERLIEAQRAHDAHRALTHDYKSLVSDIAGTEESIRQAERTLRGLQERHQKLTDISASRQRELVRSAASLPDVEAITSMMRGAEQTNAAIRARDEHQTILALAAEQQAAADALTAQIEGIDARKAKAVKEAAMPIQGIGFSGQGVTFGGVPLKSCSGAEQLRVSIAMAMALNPDLRVLRVTDGSLLDSDSLALIAEMADAHDYQVWLEVVDSTGEVGIFIEDGEVAAVNS